MSEDEPTPGQPACPECGSNATVPILYGLPSPETLEAVERGEVPGIAIGGCVVDETNPVWACSDQPPR